MNPSLDQLCEQFGRLVGPGLPTPAIVGPALVAGPASQSGLPSSGSPTSPVPADPVKKTDYAAHGYHLDATVAPTQVVVAAEILDKNGFALDAITGIDWVAQDQMEVVYDFFHPTAPLRAVVRTRVPRAAAELPTISPVFPGANWHERETHDFFGITFLGHPNLTPFLLPEDADFHPLRKDYQP